MVRPKVKRLYGAMISNDPIEVNEYFSKLAAKIKGMLAMDEKEIKAYRDGFMAGADIKANYHTMIYGYDVAELLTILGEHKLKEAEQPKPAFEIRGRQGQHYKIYASGKIEGFADGSVVVNRIPELMAGAKQPEKSIIDELYQSNVSLTPYGLKCRLEQYGYKIIKDTES